MRVRGPYPGSGSGLDESGVLDVLSNVTGTDQEGLITPLRMVVDGATLTLTAKSGKFIRWKIGGVSYAVSSPATLTVAAADATLHRLDNVIATTAGNLRLETGTPDETPTLVEPVENEISLGFVSVPSVASSQTAAPTTASALPNGLLTPVSITTSGTTVSVVALGSTTIRWRINGVTYSRASPATYTVATGGTPRFDRIIGSAVGLEYKQGPVPGSGSTLTPTWLTDVGQVPVGFVHAPVSAAGGGDWTRIGKVTANSGDTVLGFTNIPTTYTHLVLRGWIVPNTQSGNNFGYVLLRINNTSGGFLWDDNAQNYRVLNSDSRGYMGSGWLKHLDYTLWLNNYQDTTPVTDAIMYPVQASGWDFGWFNYCLPRRGTSPSDGMPIAKQAINQIEFVYSGGTGFDSQTHIELYGIK